MFAIVEIELSGLDIVELIFSEQMDGSLIEQSDCQQDRFIDPVLLLDKLKNGIQEGLSSTLAGQLRSHTEGEPEAIFFILYLKIPE